MRKWFAAILVALAISVTALPGTPAGASSNSGGGETCWGTPQLVLAYYEDLSQGGFIGWSDEGGVYAHHATMPSCSKYTSWPEVNITLAVHTERNVYPTGWQTCGYKYNSGTGSVIISDNSVAAGNTGACASTTWPAGNTRVTLTMTGYVSGTGYTYGPNSSTRIVA